MRQTVTILIMLIVSIPAFAQFSGSYNIGAGETYTTLKAACDAINAGTVTGNVTFYITSDLTESANVGLGVNTGGFSITFKPSADVDRTITFTQLADNISPTGHFVIGYVGSGLSSAYSDAYTISTNNVTIDGYADGGSTKRLIFTNTSASHTGARMIVVFGGCKNTVIKNCIINNLTTSTASPFCVGAVVRTKADTNQVAPDSLVIDNNTLSALGNTVAMGSRITNSGTITWAKVEKFHFRNNLVTARRRLLEINYTNGGNIYNNQFTSLQTGAPGTVSYGLWTSTSLSGTFNIYNNKFLQSTTQETGAFGHRVVSLASTASYNIYNNTFCGMDKTAASTVGLNLTYLFYSGVAGTIYHNTFYMPALTNASSTGYYSCIQLSGNTAVVKNNIFISDEGSHTNPYFISAVPTPSTDYNNFYMRQSNVNHKVVSTYTTLSAYQSANPTKDINSKSVDVTFAGTSDLHLSGGSVGDINLKCIPLSSPYDKDIDGETRNATFAYMGADENTSSPLPVELTSFTAVTKGNKVELLWNTATELNNHGFEVERSTRNSGAWENLGFVSGAGNSNAPKSYSFIDASAQGAVQYRLKQIDNDGRFTYSNIVEVTVVAALTQNYELAQNFPNPFNPTTTIRFAVKNSEHASVKVYDVTGREVTTLFNDVAQPGQQYNVQFNAAGLSSGIYFYVLQTSSFREVKKMQLLK